MDRAHPPRRHGILLKSHLFEPFLERRTNLDWVELNAETFLGVRGGPRLHALERIRQYVPVALHSTMLSIGAVEPLDRAHLASLRILADRIDAACVSDHLGWSSFGGRQIAVLPLPYTEEALAHVIDRVDAVQQALGRRILLENLASYVCLGDSTMAEWEFLTALSQHTDCGILLDVNNLHISAQNNGIDSDAYLRGLPAERVHEIHVSGHRDFGDLLADTHAEPVADCVWELYRRALSRFTNASTIVEWDTTTVLLETVVAECRHAAALAEVSS